jgi:hypothetical protein
MAGIQSFKGSPFDVRFTPKSGHSELPLECPLWPIADIARLV